ncbi:hypothetical protein [Actinoplanes utahensis]|uniref:hypothetical protein n=1 Tax=Actinoplanes utahensis TaxID=1869 RepID=UPI000A848A1C|nr:hypothetical protein [Actinoplanes utahensis]
MSDEIWISRKQYTQDAAGAVQALPVPLAREIAEKREDLAQEQGSTTSVVMPTVRGLIIASVLEECAARIRLAGGSGNEEVAALCDDLVHDLLQRSGMVS